MYPKFIIGRHLTTWLFYRLINIPLLIALILIPAGIFGQTKLDFQPVDALESYGGAVTKLIVDDENKVWMTTNTGVYCYNGKTVTRYTEPGNKLKSGFTFILSIGTDSLLVTSLEGIGLITKGRINLLATKDTLGVVRALAQQPSGKIWVVTDSALYIWKNNRFVKIPGFTNPKITTINLDFRGDAYIFSESGIWLCKNNSDLISKLIDPLPPRGLLKHMKDGRLFFTNMGNTLYCYENGRIDSLFSFESRITQLIESGESTLQIVAADIYELNKKSLTKTDSLKTDIFKGIVTAKNDEKWALGVNFIYKSRAKFYSLANNKREYTYYRKLQDGTIRAVWTDDSGEWWVKNGVDSFKLFDRFKNLNPEMLNEFYLFEFDRKGNLYCTSRRGGYYFFSGRKHSFQMVSLNKPCSWIYPEKSGDGVWISSSLGLAYCKGADFTLYRLQQESEKSPKYILNVTPDPVNDWIWCNLLSGEMIYFDISEKKFVNKNYLEKCDRTGNDFSGGLTLIDKLNNPWFFGVNKGLYFLKRDQADPTRFDCTLWDSTASFQNLSFDNYGNLWGYDGSNIRIYKANKYGLLDNPGNYRQLNSKIELNEENGHNMYFLSMYSHFGDSARTFSTTSTSTHNEYTFDLDLLFKEQILNAPVAINNVMLKGQQTDWQGLGYPITNAGIPDKPVFPFYQNDLSFSFSTISSSGHSHVYYRYRLIGFDDEWIYTTIDKAGFTNLPAGEFELQIEFSYNNRNWSVPCKYSFSILLPWWGTWWFKVLIAAAIALLILGYARFRTYQLTRRNKDLERIVGTRTYELSETIGKLKASNKENEMLISVLVHDVKGPARFITDVSESLNDKWTALDETERKEVAAEIKRATRTMFDFLTNFLTWIRHKDKSEGPVETFSLYGLLDKVLKYHRDSGNCSTNKLSVIAFDDIQLMMNKRYLEIIISNLVDNACKYTVEGLIELSVIADVDTVAICCRDNGKGMTDDEVEMLLNSKSGALTADPAKGSFKMGFVFINDFIRQMGGRIEISSKREIGTEVKVIFKKESLV